MIKTCTKCGLPKDEFYVDKNRKDGLHPWCKSCTRTNSARWRAAHPKRVRASNAAWVAANPELDRTIRAAWRIAHPEYITADHHYRWQHDSSQRNYKFYKNMTFHTLWDAAPGTSKAASIFARNAAQWMKEYCAKPGVGYQLHVLKTKKHPNGYFGPGGIVWRHKTDRHDQMALDILCEMPTWKLKAFVKQELQRRQNT